MDTSQQHLNVWSSSVNVSTSSPMIATTPSTLQHPAATSSVPAVVAAQAIITNDAPPPLPTYHFVEGPLPRAAFPDKSGGSDAQLLQQQRQHQAHHHLRQYAVDQQLFLDGDIANLSESGSGSKFGNNNNNNTITTNNTQTLGSPQSGILLQSPTALLATPFVGVQQPNFYVNNNSTTTPTSASVASAAGLATSFAPPIASPATPPGLQQQASSSMFSSSGSPGTSLNAATSGTFSASGTGQVVEDEQLSSTNIFVSHLPAFVDDVALRNLFSRFGPILSSVVMRDIYSGVSRGIAFVEFENETSASDAIASLDKLIMEDKTISVQRGKRFSRGAPTSRVFIRNIPKAVSEAELYDVCSKFGDVSWLSLHADSMRHAGAAGAGSSSDAAAMMALESQLMSTNTTGGASSSSTTTTAAGGGKQDRNIAFVTFASKEAASAAAVALHNASPFAGADGVPLLTKVVLDNLPPRRQRKASAAPTTTTNHHQHQQQQQQQQHRQMQPQLHQPAASPYGSVSAPQMFLPQHLLSHHHHQFQPALHSPLTPFNVFHPPQQQQQQQQQGQLHHHALPNLQGSPQQHHMHQLHHHQQHAGNFLFLPTDGTTMGTPQLMHSPAPMQLVPQHHQHHHQMTQQQLHPSSTAAVSSASAVLMTSPPSHQFVFATMPQGGQQQQQQHHQQFHPLQSSQSGVGGGSSSSSMAHMQGGGVPAATMQPASPFQYASPFHSSNGAAPFVPIQQQVSDGSSWSSSMVLDPMQQQQQQQQLFHGSGSGASPSSGSVNNPAAMILSPPLTTEVMSMPPAQHMMYWNASSLM